MDRKNFIKNCGFACLGSLGLSSMLQGCSSTNYFANHATTNNHIKIPLSEFVVTENGKSNFRKYILLKPQQLNFPICIFRLSESEYSALLMECTHRSCELQNNGNYLMCPCHGSEFNNKGVVQNPPADQNLKSYKVIINNDNLYIQL